MQQLEGDIADINVVDRLVDLWRNQFTGAIRFENDGIIKILYFKDGDVLSASTNDRSDSVDEILMRAGKVSRDHVKQALAKRKENETLGDALLNLGFITRKELTWGRRVQSVGVIRSISDWKSGGYTVVADYLPKREEGTMFPLPQLVVELTVTDQERQKYEKLLDGGSAVFEKLPTFDDTFRRLGLNEDADAISAQIDGTRTAAEIAAASRQDGFNTYKLLHAFAALGLIRRAGALEPMPAVSKNEPSFESDGVADAADAWGAPAPQFTFDDEPAPIPGFAPLEMEPLPPIPEPVAAPKPEPEWASPLVAEPEPVPTPVPKRTVAVEETPQWGFDEAQIETARGVKPVPETKKEKNPYRVQKSPRRYGLLIAAMVLFILAGMGYFGYNWWTAQQVQPDTTRGARVSPPAPLPTATATTAQTTEPEPTATIVPAPAPQPVATATVAPPPVPQPTPVTARQPAPAAAKTRPPSGGTLRERYDAMAAEFARDRSGTHAVQIAIVCEPSNVEKALRSGGSRVWFLPMSFRGRSCYRLFYGRYDNDAAAQRALADVPQDLRESTPTVVRIPR